MGNQALIFTHYFKDKCPDQTGRKVYGNPESELMMSELTYNRIEIFRGGLNSSKTQGNFSPAPYFWPVYQAELFDE